MKPKIHMILDNALDNGIRLGLRRYYKHSDDSPSEAELSDTADVILAALWEQLDEWFSFDAD